MAYQEQDILCDFDNIFVPLGLATTSQIVSHRLCVWSLITPKVKISARTDNKERTCFNKTKLLNACFKTRVEIGFSNAMKQVVITKENLTERYFSFSLPCKNKRSPSILKSKSSSATDYQKECNFIL